MSDIYIPGYEITEVLGHGGMGAVYKAKQLSLDRLVAIKTLPADLANDAEAVEQFRSEAKTAATLKHPHIVQVYEAGEYNGIHYFSMEYVAGYSVADWLSRKGKLGVEDSLLIIESVAKALDYSWHKAHIIHGDIKPENIMVDEDGTIKVTDFLALRQLGEGSSPDYSVIGTPNYMSPEQVQGVPEIDSRADMYSLGAVLYQLTTGILPFGEFEKPEAIMDAQLHARLKDPRKYNPDLQPGLVLMLERMMARDATLRHDSWEFLLADVERVAQRRSPLSAPVPAGASTVDRIAEGVMTGNPGTTQRAISVPASDSKSDQPDHAGTHSKEIAVEKWLYTVIFLSVVAAMAWILLVFASNQQDKPALVVGKKTNVLSRIPVSSDHYRVSEQNADQQEDTASPAEENVAGAEQEDAADKEPLLADSNAAEDTWTLSEYREYTALMENVIRASKARMYDRAEAIIIKWQQGREDTAVMNKFLSVQLDRLQRARRLYEIIEERQERVIGQNIRAKTNIEGEIDLIRNGFVSLTKRVEGIPGAQSQFEVTIDRIYEQDFHKLLMLVDPGNINQNLAVFYVARGSLTYAENAFEKIADDDPEKEFIHAWIHDWKAIMMNAAADRGLSKIQQLIAAEQYEAADKRYSHLLQRLGKTRMLSDLRMEESRQVAEAIEKGLFGLENVWGDAEEARTQQDDELDSIEPPAEILEAMTGDDEQDVAQVTARELNEQLLRYDESLVKLRFRSRGDIVQLNENEFTTRLGEGDAYIRAVFPFEAYDWISSLPRWHGRARKVVYGYVHAAQEANGESKIHLIGRTRLHMLGGQGAEYSW